MSTPSPLDPFDGTGIISDPIHGYIQYTIPRQSSREEITEEALLDHPWLQRLRYIHQLQSAFWVYPSAEHSRFQHSLGAMHVAGRFATHLYEGLRAHHPRCPSLPLIEELLRLGGLLHDIGHGPFSHQFDSEYLQPRWGLNHEHLGAYIITHHLSPFIKKIGRSPNGPFARGETVRPEYIAFLIQRPKSREDRKRYPKWLHVLRPLFSSGIYTVDNLDFVLRDGYMTGFSRDPIDLERILHYTFISEKGVTYSSQGTASLMQFIQARISLFNTIYYHRTTRALDYSLKNIFFNTLKEILPYNPISHPEDYLSLTEYALFHTVQQWARSRHKRKRALGEKWQRILKRKRDWVMAYERSFYLDSRDLSSGLADLFLRRDQENILHLEKLIRDRLPKDKKEIPFVLDLASQDPRPDNPMGETQSIWLFNHATRKIEKESIEALLINIPYRIILMRLLAPSHAHDALLARAMESLLSERIPSFSTNI